MMTLSPKSQGLKYRWQWRDRAWRLFGPNGAYVGRMFLSASGGWLWQAVGGHQRYAESRQAAGDALWRAATGATPRCGEDCIFCQAEQFGAFAGASAPATSPRREFQFVPVNEVSNA